MPEYMDYVPNTPSTFGGGFGNLFFGAASNAISQAINYAFSKKTADYNFKLGEQSADAQYQRQLDFWRQQNDYNSPKSQVNRRLAAGLSPVEGVDSGNASQLSTVPGNEVGKTGALQFQSSIDLLQSMRTVQEIRNLGKTGNRLDAEVSNLIADGFLKELEKQLRGANLSEMAERLKEIRRNNAREDRADKYLYTDDYYKKQLDTLSRSLELLGANANIAVKDSEYYNKKGIHPNRVGTSSERVLINAIDSLFNILTGGKFTVRNLLGDQPFVL